ncbi:PREDICTED: suppressor APC domain-containing protein 2 [Calidris pugnax]|uniref:suppressor APC domain-containing protein 2 n=1 Tax=Calidris pugnax TaxID=198806 RepID=UPI00071DFA31|nr:PREDICTED: suppressor APC domain-containing protein 2 [Calidris pugnax]
MAPERGDRSLPPGGTEGLPRVFLQSLRTLFDILDDRRRGYVHLREIESRWRGAEAQELPAGVMEGLRRAAPASGYLTFERFVLGLRAALPGADPPPESGGGRRGAEKPPSPRGAEERRGKSGGHCRLMYSMVGPQTQGLEGYVCTAKPITKQELPPRGVVFLAEPVPAKQDSGVLKPVLCSAAPCHVYLQDHPTDRGPREVAVGRFLLQPAGSLMISSVTGGDTKAAGQSRGDGSHPGAGDTRRHQRGRAEHRRHTITNGVDFNVLKHMKELEQEKDFLLQGLELVERTWEWYHQHIQFMQERQRLLGKNKTSAEFLPEGGQSHLGHLLPKLQEVNSCLGDLLSTAGKPANSSSALGRLVPVVSPASAGSQQTINMLKEQNRLLTKEVTDKSERITQLEQEKSALIKQLFEARARNSHETSQLDSTFI